MTPAKVFGLGLLLVALLAGAEQAQDIHKAVLKGDIDLVRDMITADTSLINTANKQGMTPLRLAAHAANIEIARLLLDRGANTNDTHPLFGSIMNQAFAASCQRNAGPELVELLLERGLVLDARVVDGLGMTPLDWAAKFGNVPMARLALGSGADVNAVSRRIGMPPLVLAVYKGNEDLVDLLLERGADVSVVDINNKAAVVYAVEEGRTAILEKLLDRGADAGASEPNWDRSLLHLAAIRGFHDIARALVTHGIDINAADRAGNAPLFYAARYGNRKVAAYLIGQGAVRPREPIENYGKSPLLAENMDAGQSAIWYLNHRGWAIKTKDKLLVFDAEEFEVRRSDDPCLANGFLTAGELAPLDVMGLYSCYHGKPGEPAYIHMLADSLDRIAYVHLADDGWRGSPNTTYLKGQADTTVEGVAVRAIDILEGMPALGYLLAVDGQTIYYQAFNTDNVEKLKQNYEWLSRFIDTVDIAFLPLPGSENEEESDLKLFLDRFPARTICLLDPGRREHLFGRVAQKIADWNYSAQVFCAENPGDHFRHRSAAK